MCVSSRVAARALALSMVLRREDGGIAGEEDGKPNDEVYFVGIIDILTEYNGKKRAKVREMLLRAL